VLDDDHYGLDKPKRRIIEYLAVRKLKPDSKGPILCFVGPPAPARPRSASPSPGPRPQVLPMSLGGVRDEAEIRATAAPTSAPCRPGDPGHPPGGVQQPVFMLDEIDKLGAIPRATPPRRS